MAIAIKHYGVYRFKNQAYPGKATTQVLNAYGTSNLANGRNVMLYTRDVSDNAQKWRAMYAGKDGTRTLYWLNCELGGKGNPYALDRYMGSTLQYNADVYRAVDSSAKDQLVYFQEQGTTGRVYIRLFDGAKALTAAPNPNGVNGNNAPASLINAGNVYWANYVSGSTAQQWVVETVTAGANPDTANRASQFPAAHYYNSDNKSYPNYVGECTWYCHGRFLEVHGVADGCTGDAHQWSTCPLGKGVSRDTASKTPRAGSIAVFGAGGSSSVGHVVFIESVTADNVIYSHCNGTSAGQTFGFSNGEIEVRNSLLPAAEDGYRIPVSREKFSSRFGNGLTAIIYKS